MDELLVAPDSNKLFCENELERLFVTFGRNDSWKMDEINHSLEDLHFDGGKMSTKKDNGINAVVKF